jgi:hypothetical protein
MDRRSSQTACWTIAAELATGIAVGIIAHRGRISWALNRIEPDRIIA